MYQKIVIAVMENEKMAEYIFEIDGAFFNEDTGEAVMKPKYRGKLVRCKDCVRGQYDAVFQQRWCMGELVEEDHFCSYGVRKNG